MITKEQFDLLRVGDVIVNSDNNEYTIIDRLPNVIFAESNEAHRVYLLSLNELNRYNYSIKSTPKHLYGIPYGDYSHREVYISYSNKSLEDCTTTVAVRLLKVDEKGFSDYYVNTWKYAKVVSNNLDLIPYE